MFYRCEICGKRFTQTGHLASHMRIHNGEKPFDCKLCGKWFTEKSSVKRHLRKMHFNQYNKKCSVCGIISKTREEHRDHLVTHKLKVYTCQVCAKDFIDSRALKVHVFNAHSQITQSLNLKEYRCQECDKQFFSTKGLKNHLKTHKIDVQMYNCEICNKLFFNEDYMKSHMKTHSTNKERYCEQCHKHFNSAAYAAFHRKQHILEKLTEVLATKEAKEKEMTGQVNDLVTEDNRSNSEKEVVNNVSVKVDRNEIFEEMDTSSCPSSLVNNVDKIHKTGSEAITESVTRVNGDDSNVKDSDNIMDLKDIQAAFTDHTIRLQHFKFYSCFYFFKAKDALIDDTLMETSDQNIVFTPENRNNAWVQMENGDKKARCFSMYRCNECRTFKLRKREIVRHYDSMHGGRLNVHCSTCSAV